MGAIEEHERGLLARIESTLATLPEVTVHSRAAERTPTLLISVTGRRSGDLQAFLAERGVNAPAGTFYALETSRRLGLGDQGALRIGLAPYTNDDDVDRLLAGLVDWLKSS
jgi:selenocysteine lyase/cysteine desulfurase